MPKQAESQTGRIRQYLADAGEPRKISEVAAAVGETNTQKVGVILANLTKRGLIERVGTGLYSFVQPEWGGNGDGEQLETHKPKKAVVRVGAKKKARSTKPAVVDTTNDAPAKETLRLVGTLSSGSMVLEDENENIWVARPADLH